MKKNIKFILILLIICSILVFFYININNKNTKIEKVLKTEYYSYLPVEAKKYIEGIYEDTQEVVLTEKNKIPKQPYLNPAYVDYLSLSEEEKSEFDVIPEEMIVDYSYTNVASLHSEYEIPSNFDLRNVNGKNYVTPIKDQGGLGLCWAFATNAQAESFLLIQNNQSYTKDAQIFSERQLDYATADDGITDGSPFYSYNRILGDGGTFQYATSVMIDGLGLVDDSWTIYDDTNFESKEKNDVYNFSNSAYEVTQTINYPYLKLNELDISNNDDQLIRNNYLNNLKSLIMKYGGSYIATVDPIGRCSISINGSRFMYDDGVCASAGHAMQVIGWDDNYEYSVCTGTKDSSGYYHINNNISNCEDGTVVNGKGAWILKNSWGDMHQFVYIAYDSQDMTFNLITELDKKDWDNYYSLNTGEYNISSSTVAETYNKKSMYQEKLKKIKFNATTQDTIYNIYVATDNEKSYKLYTTITSDFPGLYTVDLSNHNIYLNDETFYVKIVATNGMISRGISVYTDNVEDNYQIKTEDVTYENTLTNIDKYIVRVSSQTVNIPENVRIDYKILNKDKEEISTNYIYTENSVFANNVFSKIMIDNDLPKGNYIVQSIYQGIVLDESNMVIDKDIVTIEGKGTEDNPYIITTPSQLNLIRKDAFAFYELGNDIDLTYDTTNENGLFYNDGKGWEPIKYSKITTNSDYIYSSSGFSGGFDGKNYKIIGLNINRPDESGVGLFANTYNLNFSNLYIKNLVLEKPNIIGYDFVGGVVGYINGTTYERCLNISNVVINGGKIIGNNYVGGVIGKLQAGSHLTNYYVGGERHLINSLYNSATIQANNYAGGIFGYVTNITGYNEGNSVFKISNILNKGNIISDNQAGGLAGSITTRENNYITIYNSINTGRVLGKTCSGGIACELSTSSIGNLNLSNIYYIDDVGINLSNNYIVVDNVVQKNITELTDINSYSKWNNFNYYWKIETVDNVVRMPVLKFMNFNYTKLKEISVRAEDKVSIYDYIIPNFEAAYNVVIETNDNKIAYMDDDGMLNGVSKGNTTLHLVSYYDGYEVNTGITVLDPGIRYYSNYGENDSIVQDIVEGKFNLNDNKFVRMGYTFKEWNTESNGSGTTYKNGQEVSVTSGLKLYAQWIPNKYSVNFNSNGGTGIMSNQEFIFDQEKQLLPNQFIKDNYVFKEWNTNENGTGISYQNEQSIKNLTSNNNDTINLYAIWEKSYSVTFDANEGIFNENKTTFVVNDWNDSKLSNIEKPTRKGYVFKGFFTQRTGGTSIESYIAEAGIDQDGLVFYAQWEESWTYVINKYKVDESNKYVDNISINTTVDDYKKNINLNAGYSVDVESKTINGKKLLHTGSKTKIYYNKNLIIEYTNIVRGDVSGDGAINSADLLKMRQHLIGTQVSTGVYYLAADITYDDAVNSADLFRLRQHLLGIKSIS